MQIARLFRLTVFILKSYTISYSQSIDPKFGTQMWNAQWIKVPGTDIYYICNVTYCAIFLNQT
jgi:hypothetical protein